MKVQALTQDIIGRLQRERVRLIELHDRRVERALAAEPAYRARVVAALRTAADRIEDGGELPAETDVRVGSVYVNHIAIPLKVRQPRPPKDAGTHRIDRLLKSLRLESRKTISIDPADSQWGGLL